MIAPSNRISCADGLFSLYSSKTQRAHAHLLKWLQSGLAQTLSTWTRAPVPENKGEGLLDTILTLNAMMHPDAIVVRHKEYGAPGFIAGHVDCPVINAGDSWREHPTQALLDALTIRRRLGKIKGLTVAIIGDIAHSRVASSNIILLTKMGANVRVIAPPVLMPEKYFGR